MTTSINVEGIKAPGLSNLSAISKRASIKLEWDSSFSGIQKTVEIWRATSNNRSGATLQYETISDWWEDTDITLGQYYYYWIRVKSIYGRSDGDWHPTGSTSGVQGVSDVSASGSTGGVAGTGSMSSGWNTIDSGTSWTPAITLDAKKLLINARWDYVNINPGTMTTGEKMEAYARITLYNITDSTNVDVWYMGGSSHPVWLYDYDNPHETRGIIYLPFTALCNFTVFSTKSYKLMLEVNLTMTGSFSVSHSYSRDGIEYIVL